MTENLPTNVKDRLARLETLFIDHIGSSGPDIHETASRWATGFAQPQNVTRAELTNADGTAVDLETAPDGHWFCFECVNGPLDDATKGFYIVDILTSIGGRRDMSFKISADGRSWFRTIHSEAQGGTGWVQTAGLAFQDLKDVSDFNNTGVRGTVRLWSISRGIDGYDVFLTMRLDNVVAINPNNAVLIYPFSADSKKYLKPSINFNATIEDFNKTDLSTPTFGKLTFLDSGISLIRPSNATSGTSFRGSFSWHVPL
jgi:hypothetical protein